MKEMEIAILVFKLEIILSIKCRQQLFDLIEAIRNIMKFLQLRVYEGKLIVGRNDIDNTLIFLNILLNPLN